MKKYNIYLIIIFFIFISIICINIIKDRAEERQRIELIEMQFEIYQEDFRNAIDNLPLNWTPNLPGNGGLGNINNDNLNLLSGNGGGCGNYWDEEGYYRSSCPPSNIVPNEEIGEKELGVGEKWNIFIGEVMN